MIERFKPTLLIIAVGVIARLLMMWVVDPALNPLSGDSLYYVSGIFDGFRPPLYILFLKVASPTTLWVPLAIQCAFSIGVAVVTYIELRKVWPALLIAACPFLIVFDFRLLAESIYVNLLWLGWLALRRGNGVYAGLLIGLAILARDTLLMLPLFTLLFTRSRAALKMMAVAYLIALPWFLIAATPGRMALNLWIGTWERDGEWMAAGFADPKLPSYAFTSPVERQAVGPKLEHVTMHTVMNHVRAQPASVAKAWAVRYPTLWLSTRADLIDLRAVRQSLLWTAEKMALYLLNVVMLALGVCGLLYVERIFLPPVAYAALAHIPFHAEARFTLFAVPFLIVAAISVLKRVWESTISPNTSAQGGLALRP